MDEDPLRAAAERAVAREIEEAREQLKRLEASDVRLVRAASEASEKFWKLAGRRHDRVLSPEADRAYNERLVAVARVESMGLALAQARTRLLMVEDSGRVERWIRERQNRGSRQGENTTTTTPGGRRVRLPGASREVRSMAAEEAQKQAVKALKDAGGDYAAAAKKLNDEKVTTSSGKPWTPRRVMVVTRQAGVAPPAKAKSESAPSGRKKKEESAKSPPKRNGDGGENVVPIDKKAQASGTSRGGTGSRKKSGSQASSARRGGQRRGK